MKSYMKSAFRKTQENRCMFCYLTFNTEIKLDNHLNDGTCYNDRKQPTQMILRENEFIPHQNLISEMCPELMLVADCEAMLSKDPNIQNVNDSNDDDNLEGFDNAADNNIQREKPPGKISTHVPHAISVMSLNHNFEMQQYRTIWGTNVACKLLDLIQEMIAYFHDKVKHLRNLIPVLLA